MGTGAVLSARDLSFGYGRRRIRADHAQRSSGRDSRYLGSEWRRENHLIKCLVGLFNPSHRNISER